MKKFKLALLGILGCVTVSLIACHHSPISSAENTVGSNTAPIQYPVGDTTENALDWHGEYQGDLPCADCTGIRTNLILKQDKTYILKESYLSKSTTPLETTGSFNFDVTHPAIITLDQAANHRKFFIGEGFAEARALDGSAITGALKPYYKLTKIK